MSIKSSIKRLWQGLSFSKGKNVTNDPPYESRQNRIDNKTINVKSKRQGNSKSVKSKSREYIAKFDGLIDIVLRENKTVFLVKEEDDLGILENIQIDEKTFYPPEKNAMPFLLLEADNVIRTYESENSMPVDKANRKLFDDLVDYHRQISQLPQDSYYILLAAWVIHTYFMDRFMYTPILSLFAVPERGKSRTGKGIIFVSNHGIHVESMREAYMLRMGEHLEASLFLDVMNPWKKAERMGIEDILLHRFERGSMVPRVMFPEKGPFKDTVFFRVFSPLILGTNESLHHILDTRTIQINMPQTRKKFENDVTPENALALRTRLLALKARHLYNPLPELSKPAKGRLGDICKPLVQIIRHIAPEYEAELISLIEEIEANRMNTRSDSLEALIIKTILATKEKVQNGILSIKEITDTINKDKPEKRQFSYQRIGRKITALGLPRGKTGKGAAAIIWNEDQLKLIAQTYGLEETSETSESSEKQPETDNSEVSDVSESIDRFL